MLAALAAFWPVRRCWAMFSGMGDARTVYWDEGKGRMDEMQSLRPRMRRRSSRSSLTAFVRDVVIIVVAALVLSFLIKTFLVRSFYIPSASMAQTLQTNDRILVNELQPKVFGLSRGDIVVFSDPGGWLTESPRPINQPPLLTFFDGVFSVFGLTAPDSNDHLVKRVIGLPGDRVSCCDVQGNLQVNGASITEPYLWLPEGETKASGVTFDVTVPQDSLWVMGDNRYNSRDSRFNGATPTKGFVPLKNVVGRAFLLMWPFDRFHWLDDYPSTFASVPAPVAPAVK